MGKGQTVSAIRKIHRDGIILRGSIYYGEFLAGLRGTVNIFYLPSDISRIFVLGPKMEWLGVAKLKENLGCRAREGIMEHSLGGHGVLKSVDKDVQPTFGTPGDLYQMRKVLRRKKALKTETLKLLKAIH